MKRDEFKNLFLNIGDEIEVTLDNFFWTIKEKDGRKLLDDGYDKEGVKEWNQAPVLTGAYCGENYKQEDGELNIVKLRVSKPFVMSNDYGNYISLAPLRIKSINVIKKKEASILDKVSHALTLAGI